MTTQFWTTPPTPTGGTQTYAQYVAAVIAGKYQLPDYVNQPGVLQPGVYNLWMQPLVRTDNNTTVPSPTFDEYNSDDSPTYTPLLPQGIGAPLVPPGYRLPTTQEVGVYIAALYDDDTESEAAAAAFGGSWTLTDSWPCCQANYGYSNDGEGGPADRVGGVLIPLPPTDGLGTDSAVASTSTDGITWTAP